MTSRNTVETDQRDPAKRNQRGRGHGWGHAARRASGVWAIRYTVNGTRYTDNSAYLTEADAKKALRAIHVAVESGTWKSPEQKAAEAEQALEAAEAAAKVYTVATWADAYLKAPGKKGPRKQRTIQDYREYLSRFVLPEFGNVRLVDVTMEQVSTWHAGLCPDRPTQQANVYTFFAGMMKKAERQRLIPFTPCVVEGGSTKVRQGETVLPRRDDVYMASGFMPEGYELMPLIAGWVGLREGEVLALRRQDVDLRARLIHVLTAAERYAGGEHKGTPKSQTSVRAVPIRAEWLVDRIAAHLDARVPNRPDALLFPNRRGDLMSRFTMLDWWNKARDLADIPHVRFHDLRHLYASMRGEQGATIWELMEELGQKSPGVLARYVGQTPERLERIRREQLPTPSLLALVAVPTGRE